MLKTPVAALAVLCVCLPGVRPAAAKQAPPATQGPDLERQRRQAEPDVSIVNLPTTYVLPDGSWNFRLTHRFLGNLRQDSFTDNLDDLFGLDNGAIIGFEFRVALMDRLQVVAYRNNLDKTIQFTGQYDAIRQGSSSPVSVAGVLSIEGTNNFRSSGDESDEEHSHGSGGTGHRSPAIGAVVSRVLSDRLAVYAVPMFVKDSLAAAQSRNTFFVGVGGRFRLSPRVYVVGEVTPRVSGYAPGDPEFAFGIERRAGGHMFLLTFTNSLASTYGQLARGGFPDTIYMGFNLGRKFF